MNFHNIIANNYSNNKNNSQKCICNNNYNLQYGEDT